MDTAADGFMTGGNDGKVIAYNSHGDIQFACETMANVAAGVEREP